MNKDEKEKKRLQQENEALKRILGMFPSQLDDETLENIRSARLEGRHK